MAISQAIILGIVEGVTEFLPISSTAHLIFASKILGITQDNFHKLFEVLIQVGAILAVIINFLGYLKKNKYLIFFIFFSFLPTSIFGFLFYKLIKNYFFENHILITSSFFFVGIIFLLTELLIKKRKIVLEKSINRITIKEALIIGFFQSLALVPGVSRAGAVIVSMIFLGFKRDEAALYSFLLAIPTIFSAALFDLIKTGPQILLQSNYFLFFIIGFISSLITAFFVVRWFIKYLQNNTLVIFGLYRLIFAPFYYLILTIFFANL